MNLLKATILLIWLLLLYSNSHAQYDKNWVFGQGCHLIFEEDTVLQQQGAKTKNYTSDATFSDSSGNLAIYLKNEVLFFNDCNLDFYDTNKINARSIKSFIGTSYSYFISHDSNLNYYYIGSRGSDDVCEYGVDSNTCLSLYSIEFRKNNNRYAIYNNPIRLTQDSLCLGLSITKHANGKDWWLMGHLHPLSKKQWANNTFCRYLIKKDGTIEGPYYQDIGTLWSISKFNDMYAEMRFSNSGKYLVVAKPISRVLELFEFDRCTGLLSNHKIINQGGKVSPSCIEFSPSERFLYVSQGNVGLSTDSTALYQYDLKAPSPNYNRTTLFLEGRFQFTLGMLRLASNNKIYVTNSKVTYSGLVDTSKYYKTMSVIEHPDSAGVACNFKIFSFPLIDSCYCMRGLPYFPNYNLGALSIYEAEAGRDTVICTDSTINQKVVGLGNPKVNGVQYQWYPNYNLSSDTTAQVLAYPDSTTMYYVMLSDSSIKNACKTRLDSVLVEVKNCVTGVNDPHTPKGGLRVYPNPASQEINISINNLQSSIKEVKVYDVAGRIIPLQLPLTKGESSVTLNLNSFPNGLYFIEVGLSNGSVERVKFIKQ